MDSLHSAFAIHQLSDAQKASFLAVARRRIRRGWHSLSPDQQDQAIAHVRSCDIPADRAAIEAAAVLTPAPIA